MQAVKVFNINAVSVVMPDGREAILVGIGLGFGRRPGDVIETALFLNTFTACITALLRFH
ncbi:CAT RNA binding domain-containing protein, partial [Faecalibacterium prausnitzii]|uniref:CAT RNA binding domain-containing protein n=1 Tax=Faecalibacterium prausnitzii TaxID=853 RepID=UPI0023B1C190